LTRPGSLTRTLLKGLRINPFTDPPILTIGRWKVYDAGDVPELDPESRKLNLNFQIEGCRELFKEKILVRIFLNQNKTIIKTKYVFIAFETDEELAYLVTMALLNQLSCKYPIHANHKIIKTVF
jgi:hypothetical protein